MALLRTDPIDIALGPDGDLDLSSGGLAFTRGLPAIAQGCRIALQMFAGEWFLDPTAGMPWLPNQHVREDAALLGGKFDVGKTIAAARRALLAVPGVASVPSLSAEFDGPTRTVSIAFAARSSFGDTVTDVVTQGV